MRTCSVAGCLNKHEAKGYCQKHYQKYRKYGDPTARHKYLKYFATCSVPGCDKAFYALGYCQKHYERNMRYGNPTYTKIEMHGKSFTQEYKTWVHMIQRCYDPLQKCFHRYGGRGIYVCETWKKSFSCFLKDIGPKPFKNAQIDRINNEGPYSPENCRWVTNLENRRNASNIKLSVNTVREIKKFDCSTREKMKLAAKKYHVSLSTIYDIINNRTWVDVV